MIAFFPLQTRAPAGAALARQLAAALAGWVRAAGVAARFRPIVVEGPAGPGYAVIEAPLAPEVARALAGEDATHVATGAIEPTPEGGLRVVVEVAPLGNDAPAGGARAAPVRATATAGPGAGLVSTLRALAEPIAAGFGAAALPPAARGLGTESEAALLEFLRASDLDPLLGDEAEVRRRRLAHLARALRADPRFEIAAALLIREATLAARTDGTRNAARNALEAAMWLAPPGHPTRAAARAALGDLERREGLARLERNDPDGATAAFEKALSLGADDGEVWLGLGAAHLLRGEPEKGIPPLKRAVARAPSDPRPLELLAGALFDLGEPGEAGAYLGRLEALDPAAAARVRAPRSSA